MVRTKKSYDPQFEKQSMPFHNLMYLWQGLCPEHLHSCQLLAAQPHESSLQLRVTPKMASPSAYKCVATPLGVLCGWFRSNCSNCTENRCARRMSCDRRVASHPYLAKAVAEGTSLCLSQARQAAGNAKWRSRQPRISKGR